MSEAPDNETGRVMEHPAPHTRAVALGLYQGRCCVVSLCSARELPLHVSQFSWNKLLSRLYNMWYRCALCFLEF